ncbi:Dyp-type peroxidase [Rarobacter incanus]|uniref:Putative iron-dependent peroxidase n=1 Tax=Rarobacter incanus TaxID=153494 RepID=A0A542SPD5_9MICO|nr:Dyp-type peroxidase [Rarobacter incanus]TQK76452.1 putative iron-dependent peroxidase [Rarobacter incanus]
MPLDATTSADQPPADIPESQAIVTPLTTSAMFVVLEVGPADADLREAVATVSDINALVRSVGFREPAADLSCIAGIGSALWDRIHGEGGPRPSELHEFVPIRGAAHNAPATSGDILLHVRANRQDLVFELVRQALAAFGGSVTVASSTTGFRYFDSRDLLGFVDGTENPTGRSAVRAALIDRDEDPGFAGGSYVVVQKYVHDLAAWNSLSTEEQERVIGRTKVDDIELGDDEQPSNSHVSLNTIAGPDGSEEAILRDNMAFGDPATGEYGTFYIAYSGKLWVTELMLQRMFVGEPAGNYDRILDVSTAQTGTVFYVPTLDQLEDLPNALAGATRASAGAGAAGSVAALSRTETESLGIGSLKGDRK